MRREIKRSGMKKGLTQDEGDTEVRISGRKNCLAGVAKVTK